jgi:hypothetical protein
VAFVACVCCAACAFATVADASPWLAEPAVGIGGEYQSNPQFRVPSGASGTTGFASFSFPARWRDGRYGLDLGVGATLRGADGGSNARNQSDFGVTASATRGGDRSTVSGSADFSQTNLLGANAPNVGLNRASGAERRYGARLVGDWQASEYDAVSLSAQWSRRDYDADPGSGLVDSDDRAVSLSYSRALRPNLQILVAGQGSEYEPDSTAPTSRTLSLQAGFAVEPADGWSVRATYGRSRVRFGGLSVPSNVYDLSLARRTELGALSFGASQNFQASPFGSIAKSRVYSGSYSRPLTERLSAAASASRTESTELFFGLTFVVRNTDEAALRLGYALSESWLLEGQVRYTRESYPETFFLLGRPSADSVLIGASLSRKFGQLSLF